MKSRTKTTSEEVKRIKELAAEGLNISRIAVTIDRDRSTVSRIVKKYNIPIAPKLTVEELNAIRQMMTNKIAFSDIAKAVHHAPGQLKKILEEQYGIYQDYNQNKGKKLVWGRDRLEKLRQMYESPLWSLNDIAMYFGCSVYPIQQQAKKMGISKVPCMNTSSQDFYPKVIGEENKKWIIDQVKAANKGRRSVDIEMLAKHVHTNIYGIAEFLSSQNIFYCLGYNQIIVPGYKEFQDDFKNPHISNMAISEKYGASPCTVAKARKQKLGKHWKTVRSTQCERSQAEIHFESILDELDFPIEPQRKIGKYWFDYNLGFHLLIEVQGVYWHSRPETKEKDERKRKFAESKGYTVLYVKEEDIDDNREKVKEFVKEALHKAVMQYFGDPKTL